MGYETTSPQIASKIKEWLQPFLGAVCQNPMTCPDWINFHFYIMGCTTDVTGLQEKLQEVLDVVKLYPSIKGALLTEVGLLQSHPGETCDGNTIQKAMTNMFQALDEVKMPNDPAKPLVQYISWFNKINTGKSFDLSLVEAGTGNVTDLGRVYAGLCSKKQEYMNSVSK
ncbi:unnamed protein product [Amoebophrya sp. A120]|nr:unnamed protein product [Amoebophrya sp. A120]|eukprot:GSA120T00013190001.1